MGNCKKCGALISSDFIYCGRCGAPVNGEKITKKIIRMKKSKRLRSIEKKVKDSLNLNVALFGIWLLICVLSGWLIFNTAEAIKISSGSVSSAFLQLQLKYAYVKEGLSISYVSAELISIARYILSWAYICGLALLIIFALFYLYAHAFRTVMIKKRIHTPDINKISDVVTKTACITAICFAAVIIAVNIFTAVV